MLSFDERDRESVRADLASADAEVRRLAVERIEALPPEEVVSRLVERLGDPDWRVRKAAVERMVARPDPGGVAASLVRALADGENPGRRNAAVEALVELGGAALPQLVSACTSDDIDVRKFAVDALAGIGDERASGALVERLGDPDPNVRAAAADALGAIGGEAARRALHDAALDPAQDSLLRFSALHALDVLEVPMRASEIGGVLEDPVLGVVGLGLLGRCDDDPQALEALLKGLASSGRAAREAAIRSLLRLAARHDGDAVDVLARRVREAAAASPQVVESAVDRLEDADLSTQLALIQFLGLVGAPDAVVPILQAGRDEALAQVSLGTLEAMGEVAEQELDEAWPRLDVDRRRDACAVFGRIGGERAVGRLVAALDDRDPSLRAAAARALGVLHVEAALAPLVHRLEHAALEEDLEGEEERVAVTEALTRLVGPRDDGSSPPSTERAIELLSAPLASPDDAVRLAVARVLGCIARREDADLVSLLLKDASSQVRCAAVEALARIEPERTPEPLHLAIADESPAVRIAAARALGDSRCDAVFDDLRRLAEDEDSRVRAMAVRAVGRRFAGTSDPSRRAAALAVLSGACGDEAPVALAVVEAAQEVGGDAASYVLPLLGRREPEVVREAVRCLGRHAEDEELERLVPLVSHGDWSVRAEAIEALAQRGVVQAVPAILRRLETEQDDFVRSVTLQALQRLEG